jgi:hypothetical protein
MNRFAAQQGLDFTSKAAKVKDKVLRQCQSWFLGVPNRRGTDAESGKKRIDFWFFGAYHSGFSRPLRQCFEVLKKRRRKDVEKDT